MNDDLTKLEHVTVLRRIHSLEINHLSKAVIDNVDPATVPWPDEYRELVKEAERRGLCI